MTWDPVATLPIGGLTDVGFLGHLLLVASHQGRGVVDCYRGLVVARDPDEDYYALDGGSVAGIGPLAGYAVAMAGMYSNRVLPRTTRDGWSAHADAERAWLSGPDGEHVELPADDEPARATGFSPDGRFFVRASAPTLTVLRRAPLARDGSGGEVVAFDEVPVPALHGPPVPTTRVLVVAVRGSRWVLVRIRALDRWELPGGAPNGDEPWRTTAAREFAAQTGMRCGSLRFVGRATVIDGQGRLEHAAVFRTWAIEGFPFEPTDRIADRRWWDGRQVWAEPVEPLQQWLGTEALRRG